MILPSPGESFEWTERAGRLALVCRPLADVADHFFTTRDWRLGQTSTDDEAAGWDEVAHAISARSDDLVRARQVHGIAIAVGRPFAGLRPAADALLARDDRLALAVQVADCVPLLIADPTSGAVAAVHAGWRGLAARLPLLAVAALEREFGSRPRDLVAAIGPSIGPCCYQVGVDVKERFVRDGFDSVIAESWFTTDPATLAANPAFVGLERQRRPDRWFLDVWAAVRAQLAVGGISADRAFSANLCTASHSSLFCSYRRDGQGAGRMAGVIRIGPPRP
jgi:YfiH family protein